jgi:hypothetical protein
VREANKNKWRWQKDIKLPPETAGRLSELARKMNEASGDLKVELADEIHSILRTIPRVGLGKMISTTQTLFQLLNPKTILTRNPLGNELFYRLDRVNKYLATPIDLVRSKLTGTKRTVTFKSVKQGEFWSNFIKGAKAGWKGTSPAGLGTQFEIYAPTFKSKWNPLSYLEKSLGATLKGFDYAAYARAKNTTIGELGYLKALNAGIRGKGLKEAAKKFAQDADDTILQIADDYGKYVTYQDNNVISNMMSALKKTLNLKQDFGLGDMVLKYPKTPGALLMRGLEYSPVGFLKSAFEIARPILKGKPVNNREVELGLSRAITGTLGLTGLGYYLADKGIITGKSDKDLDVKAMERATGGGEYKINMSALKRWAISGFKDAETKEGDMIYSYDWAQPIALSLSIGANMNKNIKEGEGTGQKRGVFAGTPGTIASSIAGGVNTLTEQPVLSGVKRFFTGYNPVDSAMDVVKGIPSSFTPTILNQMKQTEDNVARETYSPDFLDYAVNMAKNKIPGLAKTLPVKYTTLGEKQSIYENPSLFNIFFNPGFVSTYKPTPAAQLVLEVYSQTGEKKQFPKVAPRDITMYGKKFQLDGERISKFQQRIGEATNVIFTQLANNEKFRKASNEEKAKLMDYVLSGLWEKEKLLILSKEEKKALINSLDGGQKQDFAKRIVKALK